MPVLLRCPTRGCHNAREVDADGRVRHHCCSRCGRTQGLHHNSHCAHRSCWPRPPNHPPSRADRSRSPRTSWRPGPQVHRCTLVSLGFNGNGGKELLWRNKRLYDHLIDVTSLKDHQRGGPWGTDPETQERVFNSPGFEPILEKVLGRIIMQPLVVIACNVGHHRSVATAEIAAAHIRKLESPTIQLEVIHVDANQCTDEQWQWLESWQ